jgi:hypothetical protein
VTQKTGTLRLSNVPSLLIQEFKLHRLADYFSLCNSLEDALAGTTFDPYSIDRMRLLSGGPDTLKTDASGKIGRVRRFLSRLFARSNRQNEA